MGDPAVLSDFVKWGRVQYPAQHYMLVIWDHGEGWRVFVESLLAKQRVLVHTRALALTDGSTSQRAMSAATRKGYGVAVPSGLTAPLISAPGDGYRSASNDETNNDVLYDREIEDGLKSSLGGAKLDVIGFDACLMSMIETAYSLRDVGSVMVGSEELEPGRGWDYSDIVTRIETESPQDGASLAKIIVQSYQKTYEQIAPDTTMSAVDLTKAGSIATTISAVADTLLVKLDSSTVQPVVTARNATSTYAPGHQFYHVDASEFLSQLRSRNPSPELVSAIDHAASAVQGAIIANYSGTERQGSYGSRGLAIYFPARSADHLEDPFAEGGYEKENTFYPVEFVQDKSIHWAEFLHRYWELVP